MDFTPAVLNEAAVSAGRLELVEWRWPDMIDFIKSEDEMMVEMSMPPYATDAAAEFPEIAPGRHCFMGTMFIRYPGVTVHGRGEGGHIRVIRLVLSDKVARRILRRQPRPSLAFLQSLLDIRSSTLRALFRMAHRELTQNIDPSADALDALARLIAIEVERLFAWAPAARQGGRLTGWQYNRIRDRLAAGGALPTARELAALCGISARHLHRQFMALTGTSLARYVEHYWVERARGMLADRDQPIKNIAFASGFTHANSFARAFRRATGISPQKYRQQCSAAKPGQPAEPRTAHP